jgi:hypothetical protein
VETAVQEVTVAKPAVSWIGWSAPDKEQLETAERYDGFRIVAEQCGKVSQLKDPGHNSAEAEKTLKLLGECLTKLENQLKLLHLPSNAIPGFMF